MLFSSDENQAVDLLRVTFTINDFAFMLFEGTFCNVAKIVEKVEKVPDLAVSYLRKSSNTESAFYFPKVPDEDAASANNVFCKLPSPYNSKTARLARHVQFLVDFSRRNMR